MCVYMLVVCVQVLKEAQDKAVKHFNVEYRSNLWVGTYFGLHSSPL